MRPPGDDDGAPGSWDTWDPNIQSFVVKVTGEWIVSVTPMIFNDRVVLTHVDEYPYGYTAGYCYPKGPAAGMAARAWDPTVEPRPAGYARIACEDPQRIQALQRGAAGQAPPIPKGAPPSDTRNDPRAGSGDD